MPAGPKTRTKSTTAAEEVPAPTAAPTPGAPASSAAPFWKKPLEEMTEPQWESLCDGCGRCCLVKLEDEDTGDIHFTNVTCRLLEAGTCRCSDYPGRKAKVPDCIKLTPQSVREIPWLPPTCAYRLVAEGKDLYPWHHLVSGSRETVHQAGISVRGRVGPSEDDVELEDMLDYIVKWPGQVPKPRKPRG
ncbi:MAG: uncharacterized protein JWN93_2839 [Hyphomicrobiales bacterium]|jgi:uncharacterized cysteine cluster protein YcgN (CxxCxxCC family)|nr:uncharacterized protein [Hyphomicrobiales bacterium]